MARTDIDDAGDVDSVVGTPDLSPVVAGSELEVAFQPRELAGARPIQVAAATLDGDRVRVDLVMQHADGEPRSLRVVLVNRPYDATVGARSFDSSLSAGARVVDYLADHEATVARGPLPRDLPGLWYGIVGLTGGVSIGLLGAYLAGLFL